MQVGMRNVGRDKGDNARISTATLEMTNDTRGSVIQVCTARGKIQEPIHGEDRASSNPSTEASPQSQQESDPQPPHRITSLGSGHNKDRLRYQPTEHHPINSTDPTNRRPSATVRELSGTSQSLRGATVRPQKRRMKSDERGR